MARTKSSPRRNQPVNVSMNIQSSIHLGVRDGGYDVTILAIESLRDAAKAYMDGIDCDVNLVAESFGRKSSRDKDKIALLAKRIR